MKPLLRPLAIGVVLVALFAFFFVFPGHDPKPHDLPVAVVGDADELEELAGEDAVDAREVDDLDEARELILDREVYAAIDDGHLLVASAASLPVAEFMPALLRFGPGDSVEIEDVRRVDEGDPRGISINLAVLATTVPAILGAMLVVTLAPMVTGMRRIGAIAVLAVVGGLASVLVVHVGIGAVPGNFLALWGVAALAIFSIGVTAAALIQVLGPAGIGLSFLLLLMLGNPASGAAGGPYLLPEPWRTGGQFMPPGAFATGLRNTAYFDAAQAATWASVLVVWAVLASIVVLRGPRWSPPGAPTPTPAPAD